MIRHRIRWSKGTFVVLALGAVVALAGCRSDGLGTPAPIPVTSIPTEGTDGGSAYDDPGYDDPGYDDGYDPGDDDPGYDDGYDPGYDDPGYDDGYDPGYDDPGYDDGYDPGYDDPGYDDGSTNPCAFAGDPLCPHTPITIPAPDLSPW